MTETPPDDPGASGITMTERYGKAQTGGRVEDVRFLTGRGQYTDDLSMPGQLHGVVVRSVEARGRLISVEAAEARACPGVVAVLTAHDLDGIGDIPCPLPLRRSDGRPMFVPARPVLARDTVAYVGEPIAFVIAETRHLALDAAERIEVGIDPLPAVVSLVEAAASDAGPIHTGTPDNECFALHIGDTDATDAAFDAALHIVRRTIPVARVQPNPMEPRAAIATYDPQTGQLTLIAPTQSPHRLRDGLAGMLGLAPSGLRVISPDVGGAFGNRASLYPEYALTLLAARMTGRPVRWTSDRSEGFLADDQAREQVIEAELALDGSGRFLAVRADILHATGARLSPLTPVPIIGNLAGMTGLYDIPAASVRTRGIFTNTPPTSPYRGAGRPEAALVIETLVDAAATEIGLDRRELRRRNLITADALPYRTALGFTFTTGDYPDNMRRLLDLAGYDRLAVRRDLATARGKILGFGFANVVEQANGDGMEEHATLTMTRNGGCVLSVGSHSQGQGHETLFPLIAADRLGLDPQEIVFRQGDTNALSTGTGTFGSRSLVMAGSAIHAAADALIDAARPLAARLLQADADSLAFWDGAFRTPGGAAVTMQSIARSIAPEDTVLEGVGRHRASAPEFPNGCHGCEVEIDPQTGQTEIVGYWVVDDFGTILHPQIVEGQVHGGIAQGVGQILLERVTYDPDGQLLSGSFMDYAMPRATDLPFMTTMFASHPSTTNRFGAKGAGEAGTVGAFPTITAAITDALRHAGVDRIPESFGSENIWQCLRNRTGL